MIQNFHRSNPLIFQSFDFQHYSFEIGMCPFIPHLGTKIQLRTALIRYHDVTIKIIIITEN